MSEAARRPFPYRRLFWKWHLYAGLFGTPLLILIAVTGAVLVFSPEIFAKLEAMMAKANEAQAQVSPIQ